MLSPFKYLTEKPGHVLKLSIARSRWSSTGAARFANLGQVVPYQTKEGLCLAFGILNAAMLVTGRPGLVQRA